MSEPAEAAAVARKLLEVISHPLHELSTSSRGAVVSSLCFSWVTLFTPPFSDLGLLSRTVCSPRIQNKGFRIPGWRRKQRKPSSPQKPVSGKELPLTFHQSVGRKTPQIASNNCADGVPQPCSNAPINIADGTANLGLEQWRRDRLPPTCAAAASTPQACKQSSHWL